MYIWVVREWGGIGPGYIGSLLLGLNSPLGWALPRAQVGVIWEGSGLILLETSSWGTPFPRGLAFLWDFIP